jgi:hypothetical protein
LVRACRAAAVAAVVFFGEAASGSPISAQIPTDSAGVPVDTLSRVVVDSVLMARVDTVVEPQTNCGLAKS